MDANTPPDLLRALQLLDQHEAAIGRALGDQEKICWLNERLDVSQGIIGGDGIYYLRQGFPE